MESDSDEETPTSSRGQKRKSESQLADNEREKVRLPYSYASSSSPLMPHARLSPCPCLAQTPPQFTLIPLQPRSYFPPSAPKPMSFWVYLLSLLGAEVIGEGNCYPSADRRKVSGKENAEDNHLMPQAR